MVRLSPGAPASLVPGALPAPDIRRSTALPPAPRPAAGEPPSRKNFDTCQGPAVDGPRPAGPGLRGLFGREAGRGSQ